MKTYLPVGKLPIDLLTNLISRAPAHDSQVLLGPGIGLDCAVVDTGGPDLLVLKSDPITFATDQIGWYAVQVNANDIATTGATPRWFLTTLLLPEKHTTAEKIEHISKGLFDACRQMDITLVGGHTEITYGLDRPILVGTLIGLVDRENLITPRGAQPGDDLLLTKGIPIEATAILAREFPNRLCPLQADDTNKDQDSPLNPVELEQAQAFLYRPGISVLEDAQIATQAGRVHAMHDPTEGGLYAALWELAEACGCTLQIDPTRVPIPDISVRTCRALGLDPMGAIASGALLIAAHPDDTHRICQALQKNDIHCSRIGEVLETAKTPQVLQTLPGEITPLPRPQQDEIARLFAE
jgi:hydrogenase maturation factor